MSKQLKRFFYCWTFVLCSQLFFIVITFGGFVSSLGIEDFISYSFSPGYAIMNWTGVGWVGPMPISDSRWMCGAVALCGCSILALMQKSLLLNFALNVLFIGIHLIGSAYSFINMAGAIT